MTRIGFVGLGHMGLPMAKNLLKAGFCVVAFDVLPAAGQALVPFGATCVETLAELAKQVDVIFTMLQSGEQVRQVCLQEEGLFRNAKKNLLYIDTSSIEITATRELHLEAENHGIKMLDAPVSGGVSGAEAATLAIMVGGSEANYLEALPILEKIGKKIVHAGLAGNGQAAKICNNIMLGISMIGVCEGFALGQKLGLDPKKLFEISSNASSQCWSITSYCPVPGIIEKSPANQDYQPGFMAKMMLKDLRLGQAAAKSVNATLPLGAEAAELYSMFVNMGYGEMDFSGIIKFISGNLKQKD